MSDSTDKSLFHIRKLDNEGRNYDTWAIRCKSVLISFDLWEVVNPSTQPTRPDPKADADAAAAWDKKNSKALSHIHLSIEDTPLHLVKSKSTASEAWKALAVRYIGVGAQDASILTSRLHRFLFDDSKSLEPQINQMREIRDQLESLGDKMTDAKFAMAVSEALPSSYETLKTITVATIDDTTKMASDDLVTRILREEKRREHQHTATALLARPGKPADKPMISKQSN